MTTNTYLPPEHLIASALEELAQRCADHLAGLATQSDQGDPTVRDERAFWLKQQRAFDKALHYWLKSVRPTRTPSGDWLIPSGSQGGAVVHRASRIGGVWACGESCEAGRRGIFHWHPALIAGIERAEELAEASDEGGEDREPPQSDPRATFERRLVETAQIVQTMRAEQLGRRLAEQRKAYAYV